MAAYSETEAETTLPSLIDRAASGEEVVITRDGKPVVELRPIGSLPPALSRRDGLAWLQARRDARKGMTITSVQLLDELYEEE